MGCFGSKSAETKSEKGRALRRPVWNSEYPMTRSELQVHFDTCCKSLSLWLSTVSHKLFYRSKNVKSSGTQLHTMAETEVDVACIFALRCMLWQLANLLCLLQ